MTRKLILTAVLLLAFFSLRAEDKSYVVTFYNVENFFDIYDDPSTRDEEFTPDGPKEWTQAKYDKKLANISKVLRLPTRPGRQSSVSPRWRTAGCWRTWSRRRLCVRPVIR